MGNIFGNKKQTTRITEQDKAVLVSDSIQQNPLEISQIVLPVKYERFHFCIATKAAERQT